MPAAALTDDVLPQLDLSGFGLLDALGRAGWFVSVKAAGDGENVIVRVSRGNREIVRTARSAADVADEIVAEALGG